MSVEFLASPRPNDGSEIAARSGVSFDKDYTLRLARAPRGKTAGTACSSPTVRGPRPNAACGLHRQSDPHAAAVARPPPRTCPTRRSAPRRSPPSTRSATAGDRALHHWRHDHEQQREGDYLTTDAKTLIKERVPSSLSRTRR